VLQFSTRDGGEISTRDLQKIVQALPQYSDQVEKLTLHIEVGDCCHRIYVLTLFIIFSSL
jgi:syntaxin-binding protein 1